MPPEEDPNLNRIDAINKKLFMGDEESLTHRRRGVLHQDAHAVASEWKSIPGITNKIKRASTNTPLFKKFFIFSIIFFLAALAFGAYTFLGGGNTVSSDNITLSVLGNAFTAGGDELPLSIEVANKNNVALEYSDILIEYPRGGDSSNPNDTERIQKTLGTIAPGGTANDDITVTLFGEQGSTRDIKITLEYRVKGSSATFTKTKIYSVSISSAPITMTLDAPDTTTTNQDFSFIIKIVPNSDKVVPNMLLRVEYPNGFTFKEATPTPSYLSNVWNLGDLTPGTPKEIKVTGTLVAQDGEERSFRMYAGSADTADRNTIAVVYNSILHTMAIEKPFLQARLTIDGNDQAEIVAGSHGTIHGEISWVNNLPVRVTNAEIKVTLKGDVLNKSSVSALNGFYTSPDDTIVWNKNTDNNLASIEPGESGKTSFTFTPYPLVGPNQTVYENPHIDLALSIKGTEPLEGNLQKDLQSFVNKTIKFSTDFQIVGTASHTSGAFANTGPIPPQADHKTTYTIEWAALTSGNSVSNVQVRAGLPLYVHFLNVVSPLSEDVSVDSTTGEVVWRLGTLSKGTGFTSPRRSVSFQVELAPSLAQVGSVPALILETHATGQDVYTNTPLTSQINALNTRLFNDANFQLGDEKVVN